MPVAMESMVKRTFPEAQWQIPIVSLFQSFSINTDSGKMAVINFQWYRLCRHKTPIIQPQTSLIPLSKNDNVIGVWRTVVSIRGAAVTL